MYISNFKLFLQIAADRVKMRSDRAGCFYLFIYFYTVTQFHFNDAVHNF